MDFGEQAENPSASGSSYSHAERADGVEFIPKVVCWQKDNRNKRVDQADDDHFVGPSERASALHSNLSEPLRPPKTTKARQGRLTL